MDFISQLPRNPDRLKQTLAKAHRNCQEMELVGLQLEEVISRLEAENRQTRRQQLEKKLRRTTVGMFVKKYIPWKLVREETIKYIIVALLGVAVSYLVNLIPKVRNTLASPVTLSVGVLILMGLICVILILASLVTGVYYRGRISRLKDEAQTDETTYIPNEKALPSLFDEICKRSKNEGKPFCVIAFDIDGFRQINHEYGYQDANHILLSVVEQVNETIRPEDQFIRRHRSGDEFIVFAFNNNLTRGEYTANRIRERLEKYEKFSVRVNKVPVRITISAGVAECNVNNEESLDDVLRRVDEALKVAKSKKNSVERNETYESKPKKQLVV